jgi:hypothetical protein
MRVRAFLLLAIAVVLLGADRAVAGMPSMLTEDFQTIFRLNESPHERFQAISFFLLGVLVSTWVVRALWNFLARDFARLPRLTYSKALAMVVLWGLLFVVVLTMISGARELMTPGAWKKNGITYSVADDPVARRDGDPNWKLKPFERIESGAQEAGQRP